MLERIKKAVQCQLFYRGDPVLQIKMLLNILKMHNLVNLEAGHTVRVISVMTILSLIENYTQHGIWSRQSADLAVLEAKLLNSGTPHRDASTLSKYMSTLKVHEYFGGHHREIQFRSSRKGAQSSCSAAHVFQLIERLFIFFGPHNLIHLLYTPPSTVAFPHWRVFIQKQFHTSGHPAVL